jgi:hypothetical protein
MHRKIWYILFGMFATGFSAYAQGGYKSLPLQDLSAFKSQAGNWRIVGSVAMNPDIDIHPPKVAAPAETAAKKKRKSQPTPVEHPKAVEYGEGTGILLNINDDTKKDQLVTILEHGDIDLEFEVMLPKGSNSGIYLQGRYEVQLLDSWGVKSAKFSDIGGIYRNWETAPGKIYMGKAPLLNAAKAPGLWQKLKISFKAPRFNESGQKIENARFASVILNGVTIHDNVEVPLPTGGPLENNETASGPLMIQGDHGPVAIRNIRYKLIKELDYKVSSVSYDVFHGNFNSTADFAAAKPAFSGKSEDLSVDVLDVDNAYGIRLKGELTVPADDRYKFTAMYSGGEKFILNNNELFNHPTPDGMRRDTVSVKLKAGTYPFEILNFKDAGWLPPRLALFVETPTSTPKPLHALSSFPPNNDPTSSIFLQPGNEPRLVRAFLDYKGDPKQRLTHTVGVGDPSGIHYVYDLRSANLVCVWRGRFVDATPMWHDRGDGSFRPIGAALYLTNNQGLAYLSSDSEAFPAMAKEGDLTGKGYSIEEGSGRPIFNFVYRDLEAQDRVYPADDNASVVHEISITKGTPKQALYYKIAEGSSIQQLSNGLYSVNDAEYYVKPGPGSNVTIRDVSGKKELIAPITKTLVYSITW